MKTKSKIIVSAVVAIVMCVSLIAGSTFALFSSESNVNIAVTSGKVDVTAKVVGAIEKSYDSRLTGANEKFAAVYNEADNTLSISEMSAGDKATFNIVVTNNSTIDVKYRTTISTQDGIVGDETMDGLFDALNVTFGGVQGGYDGSKIVSKWTNFVGDVTDGKQTNTVTVPVSVELPYESKAQGAGCTLTFSVEAVQGNADVFEGFVTTPAKFNELTPDTYEALETNPETGMKDVMITFGTVNLSSDNNTLSIGKYYPDKDSLHSTERTPMNLVLEGDVLNTNSKGYKDIDSSGADCGWIDFCLPANSVVTVRGMTVNGSYGFSNNIYTKGTGGWSFANSLTFENCTFNGGWAGHIAARELNFVDCVFQNCNNEVSPSNCMPFWLRPSTSALGHDSTTVVNSVNMTRCKINAASSLKFEYFNGTKFTFDSNEFTMTSPCPGKDDTRDFGIEFVGNSTRTSKVELNLKSNKLISGTALVCVYAEGTATNCFTAVNDLGGNTGMDFLGLWKKSAAEKRLAFADYIVND